MRIIIYVSLSVYTEIRFWVRYRALQSVEPQKKIGTTLS